MEVFGVKLLDGLTVIRLVKLYLIISIPLMNYLVNEAFNEYLSQVLGSRVVKIAKILTVWVHTLLVLVFLAGIRE